MKNHWAVAWRVAIGLLLALAAVAAPAREWLRAESDNFVVSGDLGEARLRQVVLTLEQFREAALPMFGGSAQNARAQGRTELMMFADPLAMEHVRPTLKGFAGAFITCSEGSRAFAYSPPSWRPHSPDYGLMILLHEYAHRLTFRYAGQSLPPWYVEGFAEYLSTSIVADGVVSFGGANASVQYDLKQRPWLPFERLLDPGFRVNGRDADMQANAMFYAQSWLLTHYLFSDAERMRRTTAYLGRVAAGDDPVAAFESALGFAPSALPIRLRRYYDELPVVDVSVRQMATPKITVQALPADVGEAALDHALLKTCPDKEQGLALLKTLRARSPAKGEPSPMLRLGMARAELLFGDAEAAHADLLAMTAADNAPAEAFYLLGRAWRLRAEGLEGEARQQSQDQARAAFLKAYRLDKLDPPTLYYLGQSLAQRGVNANALNAAQGARYLEPMVADYALQEARLQLAAGDRVRAAQALQAQASNPHNTAWAASVRQVIDNIRSGTPAQDVFAPLDRKDSPP